MSLTSNFWQLSVFSDFEGLPATGTSAAVLILKKTISNQEMQSIAKQLGQAATCFILPSDEQTQFLIRTFNSLNEIQLCGHGLLACAKVIQQAALSSKFTLSTNQQVIDVDIDDKQIWLGFENIAIETSQLPSWAEKCFSSAPLYASKAGSDSDYWIFEWPASFALESMSVDFGLLAHSSNRAVICCQATDELGFDFNLRYFAPQYGVNEDIATGSANRVLAAYWDKKGEKSSFKARQLSEQGAVILCKAFNSKLWISGRIELEKQKLVDLTQFCTNNN